MAQRICILKKAELTQERSLRQCSQTLALNMLFSATLREENISAETNETVNKKVLKAFEHGLTPIMCCGETLEQREQGVTMDFIRQQVKSRHSRMLQQIRLRQQ